MSRCDVVVTGIMGASDLSRPQRKESAGHQRNSVITNREIHSVVRITGLFDTMLILRIIKCRSTSNPCTVFHARRQETTSSSCNHETLI